MKDFLDKNGHFFTEMAQYVEAAEDKDAAAKEAPLLPARHTF